METKTFNIPASKQNSVEIQLSKFNKRAIKFDIPALVWSWGKAFTQSVSITNESVIDGHQETVDVDTLFLPIEVTGEFTVTFNDWEFICSLQHLQTGENIIRSMDKEFQVPNQYRSGSACEHCQVKRYRKETYLLRHSNGDLIQVGSTCIGDFLNNKSPHELLNKASLVAEFISFMDGTSTGGSGGDIVFPIIDFLAQTSAVIRDHGWVSKSKAFVIGPSTSSRVLDNLIPSQMPVTTFIRSIILKEDLDKAQLVLAWCEDLTDGECYDSDYLHNLRAIARSALVGMRTVGFATSMVQAYDRAMQNAAFAANKSNSIHLGNIKDKLSLPLTLKFDFVFSSTYGESHRYIFHDDNENVLAWSASKDNHLEVGKRYQVKGTIKNHSDYKGVLQTNLTRCQVEALEEN